MKPKVRYAFPHSQLYILGRNKKTIRELFVSDVVYCRPYYTVHRKWYVE